MTASVQITYRDMDPSDAVNRIIHKKAARLDGIFSGITGCRVVVESPHNSHRHGNKVRVAIDLSVPGQELVVGRDGSAAPEHEDVYAAVNDAFRAAERQLKAYADRLQDRGTGS